MIVLTAQELRDLTDRVRPTYQARVLDALKIPYRWRPKGKKERGTLIVLRIHAQVFDPQPAPMLRSRFQEPVLQP